MPPRSFPNAVRAASLSQVKLLFAGILWMGLSASGASSPRAAATLSASETGVRLRNRPGKILLTLGLQELRDNSPQSLIQLDVQVPVVSTLSVGLQAMAPSRRKNLSYYLGGSAHWYPLSPHQGPWLNAGVGKYIFRATSAQTGYVAGRLLAGWRWRPVNQSGSFGFAVGPELAKVGGRTVWGGVLRFDVGADLRPEALL